MREIKFRGVQAFGTEKGRMLFGSIHFNHDEAAHYEGYVCTIHEPGRMPIYVDPETVGQLTGQDDIKNNPIYEGDILECHEKGLISVEWCDWGYWKGVPIDFEREKGQGDARDYGMLFTFGSGFEVIGNIHQDSHLLEGRK